MRTVGVDPMRPAGRSTQWALERALTGERRGRTAGALASAKCVPPKSRGRPPGRGICRCSLGEIRLFADRASMDFKINRRAPVEPYHSRMRSNLARKLRSWRLGVVDRRASASMYSQEILR